MNATPPPLGAKLTGYRLAVIMAVLIFGSIKIIVTYMGQSVAPTALEWFLGTCLIIVILWIGVYKDQDRWKWFFQDDFAPAIGYFAKRVVGGAMWLLFCRNGIPVLSSLGLLAGLLGGHIISHYFPDVSLVAMIAFGIIVGLCLTFLWFGVGHMIPRIRVLKWGLKGAEGFVDVYGHGAAEPYGWFGAAGTLAGFCCGVALLLLPSVVFYICYYLE